MVIFLMSFSLVNLSAVLDLQLGLIILQLKLLDVTKFYAKQFLLLYFLLLELFWFLAFQLNDSSIFKHLNSMLILILHLNLFFLYIFFL